MDEQNDKYTRTPREFPPRNGSERYTDTACENLCKLFTSRLENLRADINHAKELLTARMDGMDKNVETAMEASNVRMANTNEWRDTVTTLVDGKADQSDMAKIEEDIRLLRDFQYSQMGKASQQSVTTAQLLGLAGVLIGIAGILITLFR